MDLAGSLILTLWTESLFSLIAAPSIIAILILFLLIFTWPSALRLNPYTSTSLLPLCLFLFRPRPLWRV